jgi:hypothetical protein
MKLLMWLKVLTGIRPLGLMVFLCPSSNVAGVFFKDDILMVFHEFHS